MKRILITVVFVFLMIITGNLWADTQRSALNSAPPAPSRTSISVTNLNQGVTVQQLVQSLLGAGVSYSNVTYTGAGQAAGSFTNGDLAGINIPTGIILSSGSAAGAIGPNNATDYSISNGLQGDAQLSQLIGGAETNDACILEFDFIPISSNIQFNFVMGSEEYPEYLNFHDVFGFFLDGVNIALLPGTNTPIAINTVNHLTNPQYYVSNSPATHDIQCDGYTVVLPITASVTPGVSHHIKLAVADMGDFAYDTWIFLQQNSFISGSDLSISMTIPPVFNPGGSNEYQFNATNAGPTIAEGAAAEIRLPYNFSNYTTQTSAGTAVSSQNIITWNIGNIPVGAQRTLTVMVSGIQFEPNDFAGMVTSAVFDPVADNNSFPEYQSPVANPDLYSTNEDAPLAVPTTQGLLVNDRSYTYQHSNCILVSGPAHAQSFSLGVHGGFSYTPVANYFGQDSFEYYVLDGTNAPSDTTTVTITVNAINDPPTIDLPAAGSFRKGESFILDTSSYIGDVDNTNLMVSAAQGAHIQTVVNGNIITFSCFNWTGTELISVTVTDSLGLSATDQIEITVVPALTCHDIQYTTAANGVSPYNGMQVTVEGIVTGDGYGTGRFFIGDPSGGMWSGLYIYATNAVTVGDRVLLSGTVHELLNFTRLYNLTGFHILASGEPLPPATAVNATALTEPYEGVLCKLTNAFTTSLPNASQQFAVTDASGSALIDDGFFPSGHTWTGIAIGQLWSSITGILDCASTTYRLHPRDLNDMVLNPARSCYDVQYSTLPNWTSPLAGQVVQVDAVVTATNLARGLYWLGDATGGAWSGLLVHDFTYPVAVGDHVLVTGLVTEFQGQTELDQVLNVTILSSGNPLPNPTLLAPNQITGLTAEQYEGVLIRIEQVTVSQVPDVNQEFLVSKGAATVRVDNRLYPLDHTWEYMDLGRDWRSITGILDYINSSFRILPRNDSDMLELQEFVVMSNFSNHSIQIMDTQDNTVFGPYLEGQLGTDSCFSIALAPNCRDLFLSNFDGFTIFQIDVNNPFNPVLVRTYNPSFRPEDLCFSQDGRFLLFSDGGSVTYLGFIDTNSNTMQEINISPKSAQGISIGPDGKVLVNDCLNHAVYQYQFDYSTGTLNYTDVALPVSYPFNTEIHPSGKYAVLCGYPSQFVSLNQDNSISVLQVLESNTWFQSARFSADGNKLFALGCGSSPDVLFQYSVAPDGTLSLINQFNTSFDQSSGFYGVDAITTDLDGINAYVGNSTSDILYPHLEVVNTLVQTQTTVDALNPTSLEMGNLPLQAMFVAGSTIAGVGDPVKFTQYSSGNPETFLWYFGDGTTSTLRHPEHIYTSMGLYTVSLIVTSGSRNSTIVKTDYISVQGTPEITLSTNNLFAEILTPGTATRNFTICNTGSLPASYAISELDRSPSRSNELAAISINSGRRGEFAMTPANQTMESANQIDNTSFRTVDWLEENPLSGSIPAGDSVVVTVTFNSSAMDVGSYYAVLQINSNDPVNPVQGIAVTMDVFENLDPPLNVVATAGNNLVNISWTAPVTRSLQGYQVWRLLSGQEANEASWTPLTPTPITTTTFTDNYPLTLTAGNYKWAVKALYSGGMMSAAALSNQVYLAMEFPEIALSTTALTADLLSGESSQQTFTISNTGELPLDFNIAELTRALRAIDPGAGITLSTQRIESAKGDSPEAYQVWLAEHPESGSDLEASSGAPTRVLDWLSEDPLMGTIPPLGSMQINVTFNTVGLSAGAYLGQLQISSNDPLNPIQYVNVSLGVTIPNFTTIDNENNAHTGVPDNDLDVYLFNDDSLHPIEFNIFVSNTTFSMAQLAVLAWDVDETSGEVDHAYLNGHFLGALTGANSQWSTSVFEVNPAWVVAGPNGQNLVQIYVDINDAGWATTIDWGQMIFPDVNPDVQIRYVALADSVYTTGMSIGITQELDTNLSSYSILVETNILDPNGINVDGASNSYTIHGNNDDAVIVQRSIPAGSLYGTYQVQTLVYDADHNLLYDTELTPFQVIQPGPKFVFDPPSLNLGTVYVSDTLSVAIEISNIGYNQLNISSLNIPNAAFNLSGSTFAIPRMQSRELIITYRPTVAATLNLNMQVASNDISTPNYGYPISVNSLLYPAPLYSNILPEQINHDYLNYWQVMAQISFADTMIVDAVTLQYRFDKNGNGSYDATEPWTAIVGYASGPQIDIVQALSWRRDGDHLCFEFRAQNMRHSGWRYTGTANAEGIADDFYVRLDASGPTWIDYLAVTASTLNSFSLQWTEAYDPRFESYEIFYATHSVITDADSKWDDINDPALAMMATTATTITGLSPGETYYFAIRGRDSVGNYGVFSDEVSALTGAADMVQNAHIVLVGTSALLSWDAYPGATEYTIYQAPYPEGPWTLINTTSQLSIAIDTTAGMGFYRVSASGTPVRKDTEN